MVTNDTKTMRPFVFRMVAIATAILITGGLGFHRYLWPDIQRHQIVQKLESLEPSERLRIYQEVYPIYMETIQSRPFHSDMTRVPASEWGDNLAELSPSQTIACESHFKIQFPQKVGLEIWPDLNDFGMTSGFGVTIAVEGKRRLYYRDLDLSQQVLQ